MKNKGKIYLILGALCEIYYIGTIIFGGIVNFAVFYLGIGILLILLGLFKRKSKKEYMVLRPGKIKTVIKIGCYGILVSFILIEGLIIQAAISKHSEKE